MSRLLPNVTEDMLYADYWISDERLHQDLAIVREAVQQQILAKATSLVDVVAVYRAYQDGNTEEWQNLVAAVGQPTQQSISATAPSPVLYDDKGQELTPTFWEQLKVNAQITHAANGPQAGLTVRRSALRRWPTDAKVFKTPEDREFDRFQDTALHTFEPVLIASHSRDGAWYFVVASNYQGWVSCQDIAICSQEELEFWSSYNKRLIPCSNSVFTQAQPYDEAVSRKWLEFGAYIPLDDAVDVGVAGSDGLTHTHEAASTNGRADTQGPAPFDHFGHQSPVGNIAVFLPVRTEEGALDVRRALVSSKTGVHLGYLPYTRASVISSAFSLLTERYGWGDSFGNHDCSSLVMDAYRTVGIQLPRDADQQEDTLPNRLVFPPEADAGERDELLRALHPGDPLYMPGHTMLYLGCANNHHYVIHDFAGYSYVSNTGEIVTVPVNEIMVSTLDILTSSGKSYLESLTSGCSLFPE